MQFAYEAIRGDGRTVTAHVEAHGKGEALDRLRAQGLVVLRLDECAPAAPEELPEPAPQWLGSGGTRLTDLVLFNRQMKMLLEAGAPLVPSLEAVEQQTARPALRLILHRIRQRVEEGAHLSEALAQEGDVFDPVFRTMVAAGESTASLPHVFGRLGELFQRQQLVRRQLANALLYPAILCVLLTGVVAVLLFFVVPRFKILFSSLGSPLPASTIVLFHASEWVRAFWPVLLGGVVLTVIGLFLALRLPSTRGALGAAMLWVPGLGRFTTRLILGRVLRIWGAMLRCHVPLLEAVRQSRAAVTQPAFLEALEQVEQEVASGGRIGQSLAETRLADPIIVSAIRTGEDNGRLAESIEFVSTWVDEENLNAIHQLTRLAEPVLLAVMGVVVGSVAMSLFVPLFDLATAAR